MQVIPKAGGTATALSATTATTGAPAQPSIIHLQLAPEKVLRFERRGDDLVLVRQDGQQTVVRGFFQDYPDGGRNDLVLQDETGVRWWGQYSAPWTGFQFTEIEWQDGAPALLASETVPAWLIAGLAVLGVGAAASSGGDASPGFGFILPPAPPPAPPPNQAPTGDAGALSVQAGELAQGQVTGRDADGDGLSYTLATQPAHGSVALDPVTGVYTYGPAPGYEGADSFQVLISDGRGGSVLVTVPVTVTAPPPANQPPSASADALATAEDTPASGRVLAQDAEGDTLSYGLATAPDHGTVSLDPLTGDYVYTPDPDYHGPDRFEISVSDGHGGSTTVSVPVTVTPVNDRPGATAQALTTPEDTAATGSVVAQDVDGDTLRHALATAPAHGSVTIDAATGAYTYTPAPNFHGSDSFTVSVDDGQGASTTVTVAVTVTPVNDAPTASNLNLTTAEGTAVSGAVVATDVEGDALTYALSAPPAHGSVALNPGTGTFIYTPDAHHNGSDSFVVTVSDGQGGTVTSTVGIGITPVSDPAVIGGDDVGQVTEDVDVVGGQLMDSGTLTVVDPDAGEAQFMAGSGTPVGTTLGSLSIDSAGRWNYSVANSAVQSLSPGQTRVEAFTVSSADGTLHTISVTIHGANDAPTQPPTQPNNIYTVEDWRPSVPGMIGGVTDPDGDALNYSLAQGPAHGSVLVNPDGSYSYTPDFDFHGSDNFVVTVDDGRGGTLDVTVDVNVEARVDIANDTAQALQGTPVTLDVLANDSFENPGHAITAVDGQAISDGGAAVALGNGQGTVALLNGALLFTSAPSFYGDASFSYTVTSGGATETAMVTVDVNGRPTQPPTQPNNIYTVEDWRPSVPGMIGGVTDPDGDALSYSLAQGPAHGSVLVNPDGSYSYTPDFDFHGSDNFVVTVDDGRGGTLDVTVDVNVEARVDIANDTAQALQGTPVTLDVLANDSFENPGHAITAVDGQAISDGGAAVALGNGQGSVALLNGALLFTSAPTFSGDASFSYTVSSGGATETADVSVTVVANAPPAPMAMQALDARLFGLGAQVDDWVDAGQSLLPAAPPTAPLSWSDVLDGAPLAPSLPDLDLGWQTRLPAFSGERTPVPGLKASRADEQHALHAPPHAFVLERDWQPEQATFSQG